MSKNLVIVESPAKGDTIEKYLGKRANVIYKPFHKADMKATWADIEKAKGILNWEPQIPLEEGLKRAVEWHVENRDWLKDIVLP